MRSVYRRNAWRYARNLRKLYAQATPADIMQGSTWYPVAMDGCHAWGERFNVEPETVACVIAAISPQCDWTSNLRIALEVLSGQALVTGGALRANVAKARAIYRDRATSLVGYFKDGPKVTAFSRNLLCDGAHVTIDAHAVQAAMNNPLWSKSLRTPQYRVFADVYSDVARELGIPVYQFQAIIWCTWKHKHTTSDKKRMLARRRAEERAS